MKRVTDVSLMALKLYLFNSDSKNYLAHGTGFYYFFEGKSYLITNWHNVTGKNPYSKKGLHKSGAQPDHVVVPLIKKGEFITWEQTGIPLYKDKAKCHPNWLIHPEHGEQVDVVAIPDTFEDDHPFNISYINLKENWETRLLQEVGEAVFVIGFPLQITGMGHLPIWKKASIATEPSVEYNNLPCFLIDTATKQGMSGSPVIFKRNGLHTPSGQFDKDSYWGIAQNFIGIYSGRILGESEFEAQLGIVWKAKVIEEIIKGGRYDTLKNQFPGEVK